MKSLVLLLLLLSLVLVTGCGGVGVPAARPLDGAAVASAIKASGLPVDSVVAATADTDPNKLLGRQNGYTARVSWHDTRLPTPTNSAMPGTSDGGSLEVWPDEASAKTRFDYLQGIAKQSPALGDGYDFMQGSAVLRLPRTLTPDQANEYKAKVLDNLK